ncbi:MAG: type II toxin-antitoxin system Phd/YefM family antitoxin [SAR324 cluster bacterium]|jgi:antitoxin (DNA-binding transcriptional repressor) of toxin-antitoxin stability system|nr:type II toxin-antitoxin system Phd/YefM family antitoxin [SAR324 cluster bacterium]MCH2264900.1 type II toxin-antitoxin system Phd/YefM family antitoxin [SAR324 cluster bacterium]|tara:strand:+ start:2661 stop:2897 length:237 start_codon:yes stop_codon:yes gene_type:complete
MEATVVDLRYKTSDILKALDRNESVTVLYHGKVKGIIKPAGVKKGTNIKDHPFFGMNVQSEDDVLAELGKLRKPRYAV